MSSPQASVERQEPLLAVVLSCFRCQFKMRFTYKTAKRKPKYCPVCGKEGEVQDA